MEAELAIKKPLREQASLEGGTSRTVPQPGGDARALYPYVVRMVGRLVSTQGMNRPASDRMDASIILQKFVSANEMALASSDLVGSLASDLDLAEGREEAEALLGLSRFRGREEALRQVTWRSFVVIFPALRAAGFKDIAALNEVMEV
jgi:hypothetical protein